jgi:hypothetical protein
MGNLYMLFGVARLSLSLHGVTGGDVDCNGVARWGVTRSEPSPAMSPSTIAFQPSLSFFALLPQRPPRAAQDLSTDTPGPHHANARPHVTTSGSSCLQALLTALAIMVSWRISPDTALLLSFWRHEMGRMIRLPWPLLSFAHQTQAVLCL